MEVGAVNDSVNIVAEAPLLDEQTSSLGQVINNRTIENIPLNGRSPFRLVQLTPGVLSAPSASGQFGDIPVNTTFDSNFSINGGPNQTNEILIDGVPSTTGFFNQITTIPSVEATQEFKVQSSNLSAEYGRFGGGVIDVTTKSGTNERHGSLFEFVRNDAFDANNFFNNQAGKQKPAFRMNQFGAAIGGPVTLGKLYNGRNRTFFFADYQGTRWRQGSVTILTLPTDLQRLGNFQQTRNAQGQVYRVAGIVEDITALKQQEADRQQQESWLRLLESVIINANDAVVITEAEPVQLPGPHIVYVNQAFSRMMGYSPEEVIGKTPRILQGPKTNIDILQNIREALKAWQPVLAELINYHKDGSEVWVELSIFPVEDRTGRYKYWVGIQRDITNRKQAEAEVQKALAKERELSELKSRFVSTTSHEFRTPLSTILSSADLLEFYAGRCTPEKQHEHIHRIQVAALNMNELLNDILVIERAEAHKLQFDPVDLDLRAFCQGLVNELRLNDHGAHPLSFTVQRHDGIADPTAPIGVHMDEKLIRQILGNLLSNALKYSPIGMPVDCRLRCSDSEVTIEVHDQGIGVRPEDVERLFEAFHRGTNVGAISGNGLGLAIVKQSVEAHQGEIAVQSLIGKGTIMRVRLPRWAAAEPHSNL